MKLFFFFHATSRKTGVLKDFKESPVMDKNICSKYGNESTRLELEPASLENGTASTLQKDSSLPQVHSKTSTGQTLLDQFSTTSTVTLKDVQQIKNELLSATTTELPLLAKKLLMTLFRMPERDRAKGFHEALDLVEFSGAQGPCKKEIMPLFCFLTTFCETLPKADQPEAIERLTSLMDRQSNLCCKYYSAENRVAGLFMLKFMEVLKKELDPEQGREMDAKLANWRININFMKFHFYGPETRQRLDDEASYRDQFENAAYAMSPVSSLAVSGKAIASVQPLDKASS